jgi:hypothetical protein
LRNDGSDPKELENTYTIRRLCYEIEKLEDEKKETPEPEPAPRAPAPKPRIRPLWSIFSDE